MNRFQQMIRDLFKGSDQDKPSVGRRVIDPKTQDHSDKALIKLLHEMKEPAYALKRGSKGSGLSKFGGVPDVPQDFAWPHSSERPLNFLAQIDCAALPRLNNWIALPSEGVLYFFYDVQNENFGELPGAASDFRVIYHGSSQSLQPATEPDEIDDDFFFEEHRISAAVVDSYPLLQDFDLDSRKISDQVEEAEIELREKSTDVSTHQLLGFPNTIQNPMPIECQAAANGIAITNADYVDRLKSRGLTAGIDDWVLLLQLDSDDSIGFEWGDAGFLYFWIRHQDLAAKDFSKVWMVFQSS